MQWNWKIAIAVLMIVMWGGKSPFFCSEDKLVSSVDVLDIIKEKIMKVNYPNTNNKHFIPKKTIHYIEQSQKEYLPMSDIDLIMRKDFEIFLTHTLTENERRNVLLEINGGNSVDKKQIDLVYIPCSEIGVVYGFDCGCCFHYSGHCRYCSMECLAHDYACINCAHWSCGWQCEPGC